MGFPSHFPMSSPWSRRKNHSSAHGVYPLSLAGERWAWSFELVTHTGAIWELLFLISSLISLISSLSSLITAEIQACCGPWTILSKFLSLVATEPTVSQLLSALIMAMKVVYSRGPRFARLHNICPVHLTLSGSLACYPPLPKRASNTATSLSCWIPSSTVFQPLL